MGERTARYPYVRHFIRVISVIRGEICKRVGIRFTHRSGHWALFCMRVTPAAANARGGEELRQKQ